jgi:hypothetical protein
MNVGEMFPSKYASGSDLKGRPVTLTICKVVSEKMRVNAQAPEESRYVCYFDGAIRGVVLGKTLANQIAQAINESDTDHWPGKMVVLYPENMLVGGIERVAIRARAVQYQNPQK